MLSRELVLRLILPHGLESCSRAMVVCGRQVTVTGVLSSIKQESDTTVKGERHECDICAADCKGIFGPNVEDAGGAGVPYCGNEG